MLLGKSPDASGGDSNSSFFHAAERTKQARNSIRSIVDSNGTILSTKKEIVDCFIHHSPNRLCSLDHLKLNNHKMTKKQANSLCKDISSEEIELVIKHIDPDKTQQSKGSASDVL